MKKLVRKGAKYGLADNPSRIAVYAPTYPLFGVANNDFMFCFMLEENRLLVRFSCSFCDENGIMPFIKTTLHAYFTAINQREY